MSLMMIEVKPVNSVHDDTRLLWLTKESIYAILPWDVGGASLHYDDHLLLLKSYGKNIERYLVSKKSIERIIRGIT